MSSSNFEIVVITAKVFPWAIDSTSITQDIHLIMRTRRCITIMAKVSVHTHHDEWSLLGLRRVGLVRN
jgi:hypothetical protein